MDLNDWQRIEKIVRWAGLSVNSFALNIGLNRGENLYQIKRGNNGISKELAEQITAKYPELSKAWIITGEGDMFLAHSEDRIIVPAYDMDALLLAAKNTMPQPSYVMSLPRAGMVDFAALLLNRSMEPEIPCGAALLLAEMKVEDTIPGNPYLVVTDKISAVRKVRCEDGDERFRLVAANPSFDDIVVERYEVKKLFAVKGHVYYYN